MLRSYVFLLCCRPALGTPGRFAASLPERNIAPLLFSGRFMHNLSLGCEKSSDREIRLNGQNLGRWVVNHSASVDFFPSRRLQPQPVSQETPNLVSIRLYYAWEKPLASFPTNNGFSRSSTSTTSPPWGPSAPLGPLPSSLTAPGLASGRLARPQLPPAPASRTCPQLFAFLINF